MDGRRCGRVCPENGQWCARIVHQKLKEKGVAGRLKIYFWGEDGADDPPVAEGRRRLKNRSKSGSQAANRDV
jgi:hypothetical protein